MAATAGVNDTFVFIGSLAFTAEGQVRAFQSGNNTIIQVNRSGAGGAEMEIVLQNFTASNLSEFDFNL